MTKRNKTKTYIVTIREVHTQQVAIEANSESEAIDLVSDGDGEDIDNTLEYSYTLDPETWTVEEEK